MRPSAADETKVYFFFCSFAQTVSLLALLRDKKKKNNKRCTFDTLETLNSTFDGECAYLQSKGGRRIIKATLK